jgi:hypothetical protein
MPAPIIGETSTYKIAHSLRELWNLTQNLPAGLEDVDGGVTTLQGLVAALASDVSDLEGEVAALAAAIGLPPGFFSIRVAQAGDTDHDVTFSAGRARDSTDTADIVLASAITKQIDAAWSVGTNAGGLDTGSVANNTIYYLWVIKRSDTGVVDALFSASATAPTMPADYDLKQRVGWVRTNGSANILAFVQAPYDIHEIRYVTTIEDVDTTQGTSSTTRTLSLPPNSLAMFRLNVFRVDGGFNVIVRPLSETDAAPSFSAAPGTSLAAAGDLEASASGEFEVALNASSQLATRSDVSVEIQLVTKGCRLLGVTP